MEKTFWQPILSYLSLSVLFFFIFLIEKEYIEDVRRPTRTSAMAYYKRQREFLWNNHATIDILALSV
jgi:hypothetical protein